MLVRATQKRYQRDMDKETVLPPDLQRNLPHGLQKGLGLYVADGTADLGNDYVGIGLLADAVHEVLDFVGDMGDDLHGGAKVLAAALLVEHVPVHFARGQVGKTVEVLVDEALIVPEIQIGLGAVLGNVHFAMLIGAHGAGIHVDIRIQLLCRDLEAACLEQPPQRGGGDAFSEPGDDAPGHKNIFGHGILLLKISSESGVRGDGALPGAQR